MNSKIKIWTILLFAFFVGATGGYYLYLLTHQVTYKGMYWYGYFIKEPQKKVEIIPDYFDKLPSISSKGKASSRISAPKTLLEGMGGGFSEPDLAENSFSQQQAVGPAYMNRSYSYRQDNQDSRVYSTLSGGLAYSNSTIRRNSVSGTTHSNSYSTSVSNPLAVPFSGRIGTENTTSDGTILFDPGVATTEEIEKNAIPVGEGWWIILMMIGAYAVFRKMFN